MQIARSVIDNGDVRAHCGLADCGKSPMTSDAVRGDSGAPQAGGDAPGSGLALSTERLLTHASKKRRSADSRSSPTTILQLLQPPRDNVKRRNVAASNPTSSARSALTTIVSVGGAAIKRSPTKSARATTT